MFKINLFLTVFCFFIQTCFPDLVEAVNVDLAFEFTQSREQSRQSVGWNVLSSILNSKNLAEIENKYPKLSDYVSSAIQQATPESIQFLRRYAILNSQWESSELSKCTQALLENKTITSEMILAVLFDQSYENPANDPIMQLTDANLNKFKEIVVSESTSISRDLVLILISKRPPLQQKMMGNTDFAAKLNQLLRVCSNQEIKDSLSQEVGQECHRFLEHSVLSSQTQDLFKNVSFDTIQSEGPPSLLHLQSSIHATGQMTGVSNHHVSVAGSVIIIHVNGNTNSGSLVSTNEALGIVTDDSWRCFSGTVPATATTCFAPYQNHFQSTDASGLDEALVGVQYKSWFGMPGSGNLNFKMEVGYTPSSPNTNWVAIRIKQSEPIPTFDPICKRGCFLSIAREAGGINFRSELQSSLVIDPQARWHFFNVIPGETLIFQTSVNGKVEALNDLRGSGYGVASTQIEGFEIVEFSEQNSQKIESSNLLDIAHRSSESQGLMSYIANIQQLLKPQADLFKGSDRVEEDCVKALGFLEELNVLSKSDLNRSSNLPSSSSSDYERIAWQERQTFLKLALPTIAFRMLEHYSPLLEIQLIELGQKNIVYNNLKKILSGTLDSLNRLSQAELEDTIKMLKDKNIKLPDHLSTIEELELGIVATNESMQGLLTENQKRFDLACQSLKLIQPNESTKSIYKYNNDRALKALELCN